MDMVYANLGTLSGVSMLLLALGLSMSLRPWAAQPWLRPWLASFWIAALTLLTLSLPLVLPFLPVSPLKMRTFAGLNSGFFLMAGLQTVGWLRMQWKGCPSVLAALPMAAYIVLFFTLGAEGDARTRVILFSAMQAGLHAFMAILAYRGLQRVSPNMTLVVTGLLTLHALFYAGRTALVLFLPLEADLSVSVAISVLEGLLFNLMLGYFEWLILTESELG